MIYPGAAGSRENTAVLRAQLEMDREVLSAAIRRAQQTVTQIPTGDDSGWRGQANRVYQASLARLRCEVDAALDLLHAAEELTAAALAEVEHRA